MQNFAKPSTKPSGAVIPARAYTLLEKAVRLLGNPVITNEFLQVRNTHRIGAPKYMTHFQSQIKQIPCGIHVLELKGAEPAVLGGHPDARHDGEPCQFDFLVLRDNGSENKWLASQLTSEDELRLYYEACEHYMELANDY